MLLKSEQYKVWAIKSLDCILKKFIQFLMYKNIQVKKIRFSIDKYDFQNYILR